LTEDLEDDHDLYERDGTICRAVVAHRSVHHGMRYVVPYGVCHLLGRRHLTDRLEDEGFVPRTIIVDEADECYWTALERTRDPRLIEALFLGDGVYYVQRGSPLERQLDYRAYVLMLTGWMEEDFDEALVERQSRFDRLHGRW